MERIARMIVTPTHLTLAEHTSGEGLTVSRPRAELPAELAVLLDALFATAAEYYVGARADAPPVA